MSEVRSNSTVPAPREVDVVIGSGHNGLLAADLAEAGLELSTRYGLRQSVLEWTERTVQPPVMNCGSYCEH